eukprot:366399-Chlamydomonas_euryale.AAC.26
MIWGWTRLLLGRVEGSGEWKARGSGRLKPPVACSCSCKICPGSRPRQNTSTTISHHTDTRRCGVQTQKKAEFRESTHMAKPAMAMKNTSTPPPHHRAWLTRAGVAQIGATHIAWSDMKMSFCIDTVPTMEHWSSGPTASTGGSL